MKAAVPRILKSDTDLGNSHDLMTYLGFKKTYMQALKRCADVRHTEKNPSCFTGRMSCGQWIREWLRRNRDFKVTLVYPAKPKQSRAVEVEFLA